MAFESEAHAPHESVPLRQEELDSRLEAEKDRLLQPLPLYPLRRRWLLYASLAISILANILLGVLILSSRSWKPTQPPRSTFAGLARNVPIRYRAHSPYGLGSKNDAQRSLLWESLDTSTGEISLDNAEACALGLPESTPFFWDENRRIYLLNAHHSLHCLRKVRRWVTISHQNGTQLDTYPHLVHCLDHLLQNIQCDADDTPLYTASLVRNASTGDGQVRQCRSWAALDAWARDRSACFAYVNETQGVGGDQLQRFRYCPRGSAFLAPMRKFFGYQEDWWEPAPADVDTIPRYWEGFKAEELEY